MNIKSTGVTLIVGVCCERSQVPHDASKDVDQNGVYVRVSINNLESLGYSAL